MEENDEVKVLWNFNIQTENVVKHRRLDIVVLDKEEKGYQLIGIAVPSDSKIKMKEMGQKS